MPDLNPSTALGSPAPTGHALAAETPVDKLAEKLLARAGVLDSASTAIRDTATASRNLAEYVRREIAPQWDTLATDRDKLAAELQGVHGELRASGIEGDPESHWAPLLVSMLARQRDEAREVAGRALAANERWAATLGDVQQLEATGHERDALSNELLAVRATLASERSELLAARADLADAQELLARWPKCPDGCGCRLGTDDPDARECGCDGPCATECRENGHRDAMSYRDMAVGHAMDERDALQRRHEILKAALQRIAMGHKIGSQAQASVIADKALMDAAAPAALEPS